jgi:hypothetical protein
MPPTRLLGGQPAPPRVPPIFGRPKIGTIHSKKARWTSPVLAGCVSKQVVTRRFVLSSLALATAAPALPLALPAMSLAPSY